MIPAAEFIDVTKSYRLGLLGRAVRPAVTDVSMTVRAGEVFGLLGPNRAGKTTLIKLLLSLAFPTSGTVRRLGRPASDRGTLSRVGYVHENHAFPTYLTPVQLLEYYAALSLIPHHIVPSKISTRLEQVGLADRAHDPIRTFSKGMLQRLGLAQAILNDPDLLVLDEPSEGLDLGGRSLIVDVIAEHARRGAAVVIVSHVVREIEPLVDRIGVIVGGRVAFLGTPAELASDRPLEAALFDLYSRVPA
jgi:ABC-2 type transport system ATP-binding protein